MFDTVINSLPAFASFFVTAIILMLAFLAIYLKITQMCIRDSQGRSVS